jgi:hypothetical protein
MSARDIIAKWSWGSAAGAEACANSALRELTAAGYRILSKDELEVVRAALTNARLELAAVVEWAQTEGTPLRAQEISSIKQHILQAGVALRSLPAHSPREVKSDG